jgi:hypothetical protein
MSFRTAAKSPNALIFEDAVFLERFLESSKGLGRYRTSECDTQACGKGAVLSPIVDDVHARRHVAEPRRSRQRSGGWQNHEIAVIAVMTWVPHKLLWKLDEIIGRLSELK